MPWRFYQVPGAVGIGWVCLGGAQSRRTGGECAGSLPRNGHNVRTLACGVAQAGHCSAPSALCSGRAEGLGKAERPALEQAEAAASLRRPSNVCQHPTENRGGEDPLSPTVTGEGRRIRTLETGVQQLVHCENLGSPCPSLSSAVNIWN